jgi:hypothetical protein
MRGTIDCATIGPQVRAARLARGWTTKDLAFRAGVTHVTIRNVETHHHLLYGRIVVAVLTALALPIPARVAAIAAAERVGPRPPRPVPVVTPPPQADADDDGHYCVRCRRTFRSAAIARDHACRPARTRARDCLRCDKPFASWGPMNRICATCRKAEPDHSLGGSVPGRRAGPA